MLVGFADALAAPETAWCLADAGFDVTAFNRAGKRVALSKSCAVEEIVEVPSPEDDAGATIAALEGIVAAGSFDAILPLDDHAIWLALHAGLGATKVVGPVAPRAELALDKWRQYELAAQVGLKCLPTTLARTRADLAAHEAFPVVVKPALAVQFDGTGLHRDSVSVCATADELAGVIEAWDESTPQIVQPLVHGVGEGLFGLAGAQGVTAWSAHRRIRMMNPAGSGSSACVALAVDPSLVDAATAFVEEAQWRGPFMIELLRDDHGDANFLEFNGRLWGSLALSRRAGFDYAAWGVEQALDPEFEPRPPFAAEGLVCRHAGRELAHLLFVFRGPRSDALAGSWPARSTAVRDVLTVRRSDHWYNYRRGNRGVFVADTLDTVKSLVRRGRRARSAS